MKYPKGFVHKFVCRIAALSWVLAVGIANAQTPTAPKFNVLAALRTGDGELPVGKLAIDGAGNIFAVAAHGGNTTAALCKASSGCGTVFEVSPTSSGSWTINLIHIFGDTPNDGALPLSGVVLDASGNLYGITSSGGSCPISPYGCGVVYEISPTAGGGWQAPKILYSFQGAPDGSGPAGTVAFDQSGNLYATTQDGGTNNDGTVFELSPTTSGEWRETILHSFNASMDGYDPQGGVTFDDAGNLYGTTSSGANETGRCSPFGCGTVYELSPNRSGEWAETVLLTFDGADGAEPLGNFAADASGNLYGVTLTGGPVVNADCGGNACGVVYEMVKDGTGGWTQKVLQDLPQSIEATFPGPVLDPSGNLYATIASGGSRGYGVVFRLTKSLTTPWPATVLYSFNGGSDGGYPGGLTTFDGSLFGSTGIGGNTGDCTQFDVQGCGVIYEISK